MPQKSTGRPAGKSPFKISEGTRAKRRVNSAMKTSTKPSPLSGSTRQRAQRKTSPGGNISKLR